MHVQLRVIDEPLLASLLAVAVRDADPEEVMAPKPGRPGWTERRREAFAAYYRRCRPRAGVSLADTTYGVMADGVVVGAARLAVDVAPHTFEVGLWLGRSSRGRGIGTAVVPLAAKRARDLGARRLVARTTTANRAAVRALAAHGFRATDDDAGGVEAVLDLARPVSDGELPCRAGRRP
ncbi:MAG TPA: GNAT family N-acetyltransferase [Euzebya sp.]|nr:GNAT family N-acetyltransferase [Euzebya sp.]